VNIHLEGYQISFYKLNRRESVFARARHLGRINPRQIFDDAVDARIQPEA